MSLRLLLIVPDPVEGGQLFAQLAQTGLRRLDLRLCRDAQEARDLLHEETFDLLLYDLGRQPRLEHLAGVLNRSMGTPLLVLVDRENVEAGMRALELGALQYCVKEQLLSDFLFCLGEYAVRVRSAPLDLAKTQQRYRREVEQRLAFVDRPHPSGVEEAEVARELRPLSAIAAESFQRYVLRFSDLLELALDRLVFKVDHNISRALEQLARELGYLYAGPRDVVDIYAKALEGKQRSGSEQRYAAYAEEGRLLLIELLGYLASFYRRCAIKGGGAPENPEAEA